MMDWSYFLSEYFIRFELTNLLKFIKMGFYLLFMIFYFYRVRVRKEEGSPVSFEVLAGLFFLFMLAGSAWEVFMLVFDPIFFHFGVQYYYTTQLFPTVYILGFPLFEVFVGEVSVYFLGFIGLGFLCIGIEKGSNLKSNGVISLIPFALAIATLLFGKLITSIPWYLLAFSAAIVPILFFYIAGKSSDEIRSKSLNIGLGYFLIFAGEATNYSIANRIFPEWIPYLEALLHIPVPFLMPLFSIIGCILLLVGLVRYD
ncbi:MAG: hypothetical protein ACTSVY_11560 [Candidatus Helarchaeota archaeon]